MNLMSKRSLSSSRADPLGLKETIMWQSLQLPPVEVQGAKAELWTTIKGPDRPLADQMYAWTIRLVNSPIAGIAYEVLDEVTQVKRRLNLLIAVNRALILLTVGAIITACVWSYWFFLLAVGLGIFWWFVTNRWQTATNVDLGATIIVWWEIMRTDTEFRSRAVDLVRRKRGPEVADALESIVERGSEIPTGREGTFAGIRSDET